MLFVVQLNLHLDLLLPAAAGVAAFLLEDIVCVAVTDSILYGNTVSFVVRRDFVFAHHLLDESDVLRLDLRAWRTDCQKRGRGTCSSRRAGANHRRVPAAMSA